MYDLHRLGWKSFQDLCVTIAREILGQTVESFLDSNDGGRDGAFIGTWAQKGQEDLTGRFVIQCKFTSDPRRTLRPSDISDEVEKVQRLVRQGLCDSYVLMTNRGLTGAADQEIEAQLSSAGVSHVRIFGSSWIDAQIRANSRLRMFVPRLYGLGDLSQIMDDRAYVQSRAVLDSMRDDLAKVVITDAYRRAVKAIDEHGFVLIIGEPASGKSTIASLLAMGALDQWGASLLMPRNPSEFAQRWNPDEPTQLFWIDDAFGMTQYEDALVRDWNRTLPRVRAMLKNGAKIVMTSRDYIYNMARDELKRDTFPLLHEAQVVIDVQELSLEEKRQILYNHIKLGSQRRAFRSKIKPHLETAANRPRFIPEVARRLADPYYTTNLRIDGRGVIEFVDKPEAFLQDTIEKFDADSRSALALIFMRSGRLESPIDLRRSERRALERLGGTLDGCIRALNALRGSFVRLSHSEGNPVWEFQHPTISDAYGSLLARNPEHVEIFVEGMSVKRLVSQATCGNMEVRGAVVIPKTSFPVVTKELQDAYALWMRGALQTPGALPRSRIDSFLARRCSDDFLSMYIESDSLLLERISEPELSYGATSGLELANRLHGAGLLPEPYRRRVVRTVGRHALEELGATVVANDAIEAMFTPEEFEALLEAVRQQVLPSLSEICSDWLWDADQGQTPEDDVFPLLEFLVALESQFADDPSVARDVAWQVQAVWEWVAEHEPEDDDEAEDRKLATEPAPHPPQADRSIFDDIDADEEVDTVPQVPLRSNVN